ncbi:hypothetical protein GCM10008943_33280 [Paenochrobactrum glaciei]|uniref:Uncharacterized protein n=1 Tax=Paenochrobactrum glaciei TaxID=486407 RepID=A0ABP3RRD1_9HYPH
MHYHDRLRQNFTLKLALTTSDFSQITAQLLPVFVKLTDLTLARLAEGAEFF